MNITRTVLSCITVLSVTLSLVSCTTPAKTTGAISVDNCGHTITLDAAPTNITLLDSPSIPTLNALGVFGRVTAKAGVYPAGYYSHDLQKNVDAIPTLTDQVDASGHLQISKESVVATNPDLVIGASDTVNHATMVATGVAVVDEPAFCGTLEGPASFDDVWDHVHTYGALFKKTSEAENYIDQLKTRIAELSTLGEQENRSVAVLYPTLGGGVTYAYGTGSMAHPVVEATGLTNVFADQSKRVFEVSAEELVNRNPDIIVALHNAGEPGDFVEAVTQIRGANTISAVASNQVFPMLLNFAEPPTPLAVDGVQKLADFLGETR